MQATISRSSQPRRGLTGRRSQPDENLLDTIQKLNTNTDTMYILDSRPKLNATANALTGGGYESTKSYLNTIREFAKIVRDPCIPKTGINAMILIRKIFTTCD